MCHIFLAVIFLIKLSAKPIFFAIKRFCFYLASPVFDFVANCRLIQKTSKIIQEPRLSASLLYSELTQDHLYCNIINSVVGRFV